MINFLAAIVLILFAAVLFTLLWRTLVQPMYVIPDEEVTVATTTTTTTVQPTVDQLPELKRQFDGAQPFVMDPVDNAKWMLNTNDDMYEDASGKWWRLVN